MSQDHNETAKKARRTGRAQRNRPVLVTTRETEQSELDQQQDQSQDQPEQQANQATPTIETLPAKPASTTSTAPAPTLKSRRRFAGFFSTLRKDTENTEEEGPKKEEIAKARLARATRNKVSVKESKTSVQEEGKETKQPAKAEARPAARSSTQRPQSAFKTRYIIGMVIYLFVAQFVGVYLMQFMQNMHIDSELTRFQLFGGTVVIRASTLVFLALLIIILMVLARLDLLPRSLTAASSASTQRKSSTGESSESARLPQPTIRQGVAGKDDDLYYQYRLRQRREKKK
ncbi:MAG: hypothetical protein IMW89_05870 [Ktedonobacteraceae bacterium]|nr:hypothetical protein [Ktedonobacteraceae bacterium]